MPKIIVTQGNSRPKQVLAYQEIIEHPDDLFEVVLPSDSSMSQHMLLFAANLRNGEYWLAPGNGYTRDPYEAHRYPLHRAFEIASRVSNPKACAIVPLPGE